MYFITSTELGPKPWLVDLVGPIKDLVDHVSYLEQLNGILEYYPGVWSLLNRLMNVGNCLLFWRI